MTASIHELLIGMGFVQHDTDSVKEGPEYYHAKQQITFRPKKGLELPTLVEALILCGMARQKLETQEVIREAAKKLGFKF